MWQRRGGRLRSAGNTFSWVLITRVTTLTMIRWLRALLALTLAMLGWMCMPMGAPFSTKICLSSMPAILQASTYVYGTMCLSGLSGFVQHIRKRSSSAVPGWTRMNPWRGIFSSTLPPSVVMVSQSSAWISSDRSFWTKNLIARPFAS